MRPLRFAEWSLLRGKFTRGQLVHDRVGYDGLQPSQLDPSDRALAFTIFGPVDEIPDSARRVSVQVKGRGVGGTQRAAEELARRATVIDLNHIGPDELPFVFFGGPKLRHARIGLRFALAVLKHHGATIEEESSDGFTYVRHDGRRIRFEAFAASRGGDNVRGVHIVGAVLTEAGFYYDEQGVANGEGIFAAIIPRLLKGGIVIIESTPWVESGLLHAEFKANWGYPTRALAALCPTSLMRDDTETLAMVEAERARDPEATRRELDAQFISGGAGLFFGPDLLRPAIFDGPPITEPPKGARIEVGGDIGLVTDLTAFAAVAAEGDTITFCDALELRPTKGTPLKLSKAIASGCAFADRFGQSTIHVDHHELEASREHLPEGFRLSPCTGGGDAKTERFLRVRDAFRQGKVRIPSALSRLTAQLSCIVAKPLPGGGTSILLPRRMGTHMDLASAFILAADASLTRQPIDHHLAMLALSDDYAVTSRWDGCEGRGF